MAGEKEILHSVCRHPSANDPLTISKLREMDGEPVWVVGLSSINNFQGHWDILVLEGESNELAVFPRCLEYGWFKDYGITWLAYRRRPKEGTE